MRKRELALLALMAGTAPIWAPLRAETGAAADASSADAEVVVTATRRDSPLSEVPIAVTALSAQRLAETGATDIRQLNQLSPS